MKICYITARRYAESPEAQEYIKNLVALNVECDLVYRLEGNEAPIQIDERVNAFGVISPRMSRFSPINALRFISATLKAIGNRRYDIVHVNAFRGCAPLPILGRRIARTWLLDIRTSNVTSSGWKARLADRITPLESKAYAKALIHSEELGQAMFGNRPFVVVPPGVDIARLSVGERESTRQQLRLSPDDVVIIYIGAMNAERKPLRILETFRQVAETHNTAKLLMVGDSVLMPELRAWAKQQNLEQRIIFTGRVPFEQVQHYVAAADIGFAYVPVTHNFEYNPPLKTVEFLAAGLPTVATNTAGSRMYVRHEENGLLAADDPNQLAQAIFRLIEDRELCCYLRSNARHSVAEYDWRTIIATRLLPLYQQYVA